MNLARLALIPLWAGAVWGSLQFHRLGFEFGCSLCGPWGCGPPLEAAIGYHLFWLSILLPPTVGLGLFLSQPQNRRVGRILFIVAAIVTVGVVGYDAVTYAMSSGKVEYIFRRGLSTLVNTIDLPMMQLMAAGALLQYYFGREKATLPKEESSAEAESLEAHGQLASGA